VREYLGRSRVHPEKAGREHLVGVATGMYYTPMGGDIMFIEVSAPAGQPAAATAAEAEAPDRDGNLVLTGQLGDVMKESARAALTYARATRPATDRPAQGVGLGDPHPRAGGSDPQGRPVGGRGDDGALVSALSDRPVRSDVAMTGEVTLTGRVLPIGGVKEKLLGAYRAGIKTVILPQGQRGGPGGPPGRGAPREPNPLTRPEQRRTIRGFAASAAPTRSRSPDAFAGVASGPNPGAAVPPASRAAAPAPALRAFHPARGSGCSRRRPNPSPHSPDPISPVSASTPCPP
jgi:hypothetical protein